MEPDRAGSCRNCQTGGRLDPPWVTLAQVQPSDIQQIGEELAIKWTDGSESYIRLEILRRCCPCAGCKGEVDVMGNVYKNPDRPLPPQAFRLLRIANVGSYAIQPVWSDGHATGLFAFDYLKKVADAQEI